MPDSTKTTLYYVHDPMCSWCWGFRPVWLQLKQQLDPKIRVISLVGGLAPDNEEPMAENMRHNLQQTWRRIQQEIPGIEFNFDFWSKNTPRRSTYPSCRAVICAREMGDLADQMTLAIQQAYYVQARNPSDVATLLELAESIGLDREAFSRLMRSDRINDLLAEELARVRSIGVNSFPSLVLEKDSKRWGIALDYNNASSMLSTIRQIQK